MFQFPCRFYFFNNFSSFRPDTKNLIWKTKSWQKSKPIWKLKHANSILETFEYFCQISSKSITIILSYTVSKLVHFFETQCSTSSTTTPTTTIVDSPQKYFVSYFSDLSEPKQLLYCTAVVQNAVSSASYTQDKTVLTLCASFCQSSSATNISRQTHWTASPML